MIFKKLSDTELDLFVQCLLLFEEVFEMKDFLTPSEEHLQNTLSSPNFMCMVAVEDTQVIGGLTGYQLEQYYSEKPLLYIYDLAVKVDFQRQGIGQQLMKFTAKYAQQNGYEEVYVQADRDDDHAVNFYHKTPFNKKEKVFQFSYFLTN